MKKQPVTKAPATPSADLKEIGVSGLERSGGVVREEFLRELQGSRGAKVYREMRDNDATVGALMFVIEMIVRSVGWHAVPMDESLAADQQAADFISTAIDDMSVSWTDFITEILSFLVFGWAYTEVVYKVRGGPNEKKPERRSKYDDGMIGWRKIALRSQTTLSGWVFDDNGGIRAMKQVAPPDYTPIEIPIERSLLFRTSTHKNNPEGRSLLRNAYRSWYFKRRIEEIEGIGIERDLAGLPTAWVPPEIMATGAGADQAALYQSIKDMVTRIRRDEQEGLVLPLAYDENGNPKFKFELLTTGGTRQFDTSKIIDRYDQRILMTVLADFIMLGHQGVGSFSLSSNKTRLFGTAMNAYLNSIEDVFNRYAVDRLLSINAVRLGNGRAYLKHDGAETVDIETLGTFLSELTRAGATVFPDENLERALLGRAGLEPSDNSLSDIERESEEASAAENAMAATENSQE